MKKIILFSGFLLLLFSCQEVEKMEKPKDLIGREKMVKIMTELSIINSAKGYNLTKLQNMGISPTDYLYRKYEIDSAQLERSNKYYAYNVEDYQEIFNEVKENLETQKRYYDSLSGVERNRRDSIRRMSGEMVLRDSLPNSSAERPEKIRERKIDKDSIRNRKQLFAPLRPQEN